MSSYTVLLYNHNMIPWQLRFGESGWEQRSIHAKESFRTKPQSTIHHHCTKYKRDQSFSVKLSNLDLNFWVKKLVVFWPVCKLRRRQSGLWMCRRARLLQPLNCALLTLPHHLSPKTWACPCPWMRMRTGFWGPAELQLCWGALWLLSKGMERLLQLQRLTREVLLSLLLCWTNLQRSWLLHSEPSQYLPTLIPGLHFARPAKRHDCSKMFVWLIGL